MCALYNHIITVESELMTRLAFLGACTVEYVEKVYHILFKGCQLNLVIIQRGKIKKKGMSLLHFKPAIYVYIWY